MRKVSATKEDNIKFLSTYRLQLEKNFTFDDAIGVTSYLEELGISHLYLSPVLESQEGSNHGYDGIDPTKISAERGGEEGLRKLIARVDKSKDITGIVLDIVPNHLSSSWKNPFWWDVLKHGKESKYWTTFDFKPRSAKDHRIVLPVLGKNRQSALASREIKISLRGEELVFSYYDKCYPLAIKTYEPILRNLASEIQNKTGALPDWAQAFLKKKAALNKAALTKVMADLIKWNRSEKNKEVLTKTFERFHLKIVEESLASQNYVLKDWRSGSLEINYRRFFDINDLAAIRVEDKKVFDWAHSKISELFKKHPSIQGLRVDHVDGLTFPGDYLKRLSGITKNIWAEKILGETEKFPGHWPVRGSTGYEFSNSSARLFVDLKGLLHLHSHYLKNIDDRWERFHDCVYDSKREMLESHFVSELNYLVDQFYAQATKSKKVKVKFTKEDLHEALTELTSSLTVYRTYAIKGKPLNSHFLEEALAETEGRGRLTTKHAFNWLRSVLLSDGKWTDEMFICIKRLEQLTGPVMAKGLEDTALYRYCPVLSLNGVGGEPDWIGDGSMEYHAFNQERLRTHPISMSTTSTHDTKRSEDVRSRIHLISELADEWTQLYESLQDLRATVKEKSDYEEPNARGQYLIFETIIGAWPNDGQITDNFVDRMQKYFVKAAREAKTETSWSDVNQSYEEGLKRFVESLLKPKDAYGKAFLKRIADFAEKCAYYGAFNSLSSVALKATSPGLPDFYQGCELWDLSLVDPDNRRPVDYKLRQDYLKNLKQGLKTNRKGYLSELLARWKTGEIKLWLTWELLQLKKQNPALFLEGDYLALEAQGEDKAHFVSYMRKHQGRWLLVVTPRFLAKKTALGKKLEIKNDSVLSTEFVLPNGAPKKWKNILSETTLEGSSFKASELFAGLPVAILVGEEK